LQPANFCFGSYRCIGVCLLDDNPNETPYVCIAVFGQVERVVQEVLARHGRIDGVVNCVGSVTARSALATDLQELRETLDVG
jgi:NAD(P)-dependent dehydrogenase (short-subunit alcohol dehydrogenase family)